MSYNDKKPSTSMDYANIAVSVQIIHLFINEIYVCYSSSFHYCPKLKIINIKILHKTKF